ncbi:MAG: hypothetical protein AAGJ55_09980, partial [Cyanobacteria bacterium J06555_12]
DGQSIDSSMDKSDRLESQMFILAPLSPEAEESNDKASKQHNEPAAPRFLGRECRTQTPAQAQAGPRKGMFLGRECVVEPPAPAQPQKRAKVRFLGREIL